MKDTNEFRDRHTDPDVAGIFDGATPRPRAPDMHREAVFAAVHAEWQQVTSRRRQGRRNGFMLLAATICLMWYLRAAYWLGRRPESLARIYHG